MLVDMGSSSEDPPAILDYCCGGLPLFCGGGVLPLAGGALGLVLGGGGFCSGAPPGCELGGVAGGFACWSAGGVLGVVDSLDGELVESLGLVDWCEHAPTDSVSAAAHNNSKLRFIGSPLKDRQSEAGCRNPRSTWPSVRRVTRARATSWP
jgi:hypothetical protein